MNFKTKWKNKINNLGQASFSETKGSNKTAETIHVWKLRGNKVKLDLQFFVEEDWNGGLAKME